MKERERKLGTIVGYVDPWSVEPGDVIRVMVSTSLPEFHASVVQLDAATGVVAASGFELPPRVSGRRQSTRQGSYARVPLPGFDPARRGFTLACWLWTTPSSTRTRRAGIVSIRFAHSGAGLALGVDGLLELVHTSGNGTRCASTKPLRGGGWHLVWLTYHPAEQALEFGHCSTTAGHSLASDQGFRGDHKRASTLFAPDPDPHDGVLFVGALGEKVHGFPLEPFTGKVDLPRLWSRPLTAEELARAARHPRQTPAHGSSAGAWVPAEHGQAYLDRSAYARHGQQVNGPATAVTGVAWTGAELRPSADPEGYRAAHFHEDDVDDAGWLEDLTVRVPPNATSGVYAVCVGQGPDVDRIPFVVRAARQQGKQPIAVLLSTFTYMAYANMQWNDGARERLQDVAGLDVSSLTPHEAFVLKSPELGPSLYDRHPDGSPVYYSSRRRPVIEMREGYRTWTSQSYRHFSADLRLLRWLRREGFDPVVLTDEDLHWTDPGDLNAFRTIITGCHPEYVTGQVLDSLRQYVASGGRLAYLGGNGFYWVTSVDPQSPYRIEVRRGHSGTRANSSLPGETFHATTNEPGGLWRHRGAPPNGLVGIGFCAQGWIGGSGFELSQGLGRTHAAFLVHGIETATIGVTGPFGGLAADEIDRVDLSVGQLAGAIRIGTSRGRMGRAYQPAVEDCEVVLPDMGGDENADIGADIIFARTRAQGWVFSVGSVAWTLGLTDEHADEGVQQMMRNLLTEATGGRARDEATAKPTHTPE